MSGEYRKFLQLGDEVIPSRTLRRFRSAGAMTIENEEIQIDINERATQDSFVQDASFVTANIPCEREYILCNDENVDVHNSDKNEDDMRNYLREILFNDDQENVQIPKKKNPKNLQEFIESEEFSSRINTPIDKTLGEVVLMINKYCQKECLSITSRTNLIKLINSMFVEPILPDSRYTIDKILNPKNNSEFHAVCHNCTAYIGKFDEINKSIKNCRICEAPLNLSNPSNESYFILIDPSVQISDLLHIYENHYDYVVNTRMNEADRIRDIYDGKAYRKFVLSLPIQDRRKYVSAIFNTDGAPKFRCSQYSIWPIYLMLNELPPQARLENVITCGLWFHKKKPEMSVFLNPFVDIVNKLNKEGISSIIKQQELTIKLYILICCVDSVARAPIQGIKQFNGNYGCSWCLHPGNWSDGTMKYPVLSYTPELRQPANTINDMLNATPSNPINGIKYPSPFINLQFFDIISGFVPDYMHCCLEGVAAQFTEYFLNFKQLNQSELDRLDSIVKDISVPHQVSRLTRALSVRNDWKAREWENFILYISFPLFKEILNNKLLKYWLLLVDSLYILLQDDIHIQQLDHADQMLHEFVAKAEEYFGIKAMSFNLHQMLHLCDSVLNWGPLWAHSTFPFESGNYKLLKTVKCARGVTQQIARFVDMNHSSLILQERVYPNACDIIKIYCDDILNAKLQNTLKINDITYLGKGNAFEPDNNLTGNLNLSSINTRIYLRIVKNGCLYAVSKPNKRSNDSFVLLEDGIFAQINSFIVDTENQQEFALCNTVLTCSSFHNNYKNLKKIESITDDIIVIPTSAIKTICVFVKVHGQQYISAVPNLLHY